MKINTLLIDFFIKIEYYFAMFKKILYWIIIAVGILGIGNTLFYIKISVGVTLGVILPGMIGLLLIGFCAFKLATNGEKLIANEGFKRMIVICLVLVIFLFLIIEGLIISSYGFDNQPKQGADYVIVLGCGIFPDGSLTRSLNRRLDVAYDYLIENENTMCIVSGGQGGNEPYSEAKAMAEYLIIQKAIETSRVIMEDQSTSTSENLLFSKEIIKKLGLNGDIAVATSDFHMFRTKYLAKKYGMGDIITLPSKTASYLFVNVHLREFFAVIKSFLLD